MESSGPPTWAEGDPQVLAGQFVAKTGASLQHYPTKYYGLVAATAAASVHNVLTTSSPASRQQQIENIRATAAAVVQAFRARPSSGDNPNAGARGTPAALQKLDRMVQQLQQQQQQRKRKQDPQPEPQLVTVAFEVSLVLRLCCAVQCHASFRSVSLHVLR